MTADAQGGDWRPTWRQLLADTTDALAGGAGDAPWEARRLVERASGLDSGDLVLALDERATARSVAHLAEMVRRRRAGEPLQYVVGSWGFRTLDLLVDRRVLIPRPETEQVVEVAIGELRRLGADDRPVTVADLGTGSGAIALSIAAEVLRASVWATDRSADALAVARANLAGLGRAAARVRLTEGDWFGALPDELRGGLDAVVSNPPYVAAAETLPEEVASWEPASALVAGPTGTEAIAEVLAGASVWLAPGGVAVLEIAPHQVEPAVDLARRAGLVGAEVRPDLAGRPRALVARRH